jgi:hypothetical protein
MLIEVPLMCQQRITVTAANVEAARGPGNFVAFSLFGRHVPRRDGRRRLWNSRAIAFVDRRLAKAVRQGGTPNPRVVENAFLRL